MPTWQVKLLYIKICAIVLCEENEVEIECEQD